MRLNVFECALTRFIFVGKKFESWEWLWSSMPGRCVLHFTSSKLCWWPRLSQQDFKQPHTHKHTIGCVKRWRFSVSKNTQVQFKCASFWFVSKWSVIHCNKICRTFHKVFFRPEGTETHYLHFQHGSCLELNHTLFWFVVFNILATTGASSQCRPRYCDAGW